MPDAGLYRDEADSDWNFSAYRGQNANMHLTEALLATFEATNDARYLDRALAVADAMTRRQAAQAGGLVWEHYDQDWNIDWDYHRDDPKHLFRPWGFQPGHQTEWAKLLLILDRYRPQDWLLPTATHLYETAVDRAWDSVNGGLCYGFDAGWRDLRWRQVFLGAGRIAGRRRPARRAHQRPAPPRGLRPHLGLCVAPLRRSRPRRLVPHPRPAEPQVPDEKSPAGKTDYHTMGACHEVLAMLRRSPRHAAP